MDKMSVFNEEDKNTTKELYKNERNAVICKIKDALNAEGYTQSDGNVLLVLKEIACNLIGYIQENEISDYLIKTVNSVNKKLESFSITDEKDCVVFNRNFNSKEQVKTLEFDISNIPYLLDLRPSNNDWMYSVKTLILTDNEGMFDNRKLSIHKIKFCEYFKNLTNLIISENVRCILEESFSYCNKLKRVTIKSKNMAVIYDRAFTGCESLSEVIFDKDSKIDLVGNEVFSDCLSLESVEMKGNVLDFGIGVFSDCRNLRNVILNNNIRHITPDMFYKCKNIENFQFPSRLNCINSNSLVGVKFDDLILPNSSKYTLIRCDAFRDCDLKSIRFPEHVEMLDLEGLFVGNQNLNTIHWPSTVERVTENNLDLEFDRILHKDLKIYCKSLHTIPNILRSYAIINC